MIKSEKFGVLTLFIIAALLSLGVNYLSPSGIALRGQWDKSIGVVTAKSKQDVVDADIEINNPLRVLQMIKGKEMISIDVRLKQAFDMGHLPDALSFPLSEFDDGLPQLLDLVKKDMAVLVYCSGVECSDSHTFAAKLLELNFTKVRVYPGGFQEWQEMGFEIEKNEG
jgi:rhodanese-related sulfurtransferase